MKRQSTARQEFAPPPPSPDELPDSTQLLIALPKAPPPSPAEQLEKVELLATLALAPPPLLYAVSFRSVQLSSVPETIPPPPDGFVIQKERGAFSTHNGPYFERAAEQAGQADLVDPAEAVAASAEHLAECLEAEEVVALVAAGAED